MNEILEDLKKIALRNCIDLESGFDDDVVVLNREGQSVVCVLSNLGLNFPSPDMSLLKLDSHTDSECLTVELVISKDGDTCMLAGEVSQQVLINLKLRAMQVMQDLKYPPVLSLQFLVKEDGVTYLTAVGSAVNLIKLNEISSAKASSMFETVLRSVFPDIFYAALMDPGQKFFNKALAESRRKRQSKDFFYHPEGIDLEITQKCTLACRQCSILTEVKAGFPGLKWKIYSEALNQASDLGIYAYSITGGEPFTRYADICRIIENSQAIECFKVQTNCTYFSSFEKSKNLIQGLISAGFGNNQITNACLQSSQGMQNYEANADSQNIFHLARAIKPYLAADASPLISFGLIYTLDPFVNELDLYARLRRELTVKADIDWSHDRAFLRVTPVDFSDETASQHWEGNLIPLRELLEIRLETFGSCFHSELTPWPRMLMRANGEVFACTCFGHVFLLGKYPENSLEQLIKTANGIPAFRRIHQDGLLGLLDYMEEQRPGLGQTLVPGTMTACQLCGIINGVRSAEMVKI